MISPACMSGIGIHISDSRDELDNQLNTCLRLSTANIRRANKNERETIIADLHRKLLEEIKQRTLVLNYKYSNIVDDYFLLEVLNFSPISIPTIYSCNFLRV